MENKQTLPKLADLYDIDNIDRLFKEEEFNLIVNQEPKAEWIKINKYAGNSNYIPIGIIETLLQKLFKTPKIEILREGVMFNSVYVVVRLHYSHPLTGQIMFQDGIGAQEMQTKQGASAADLAAINKGAVMMALPAAESYATKDAAEKIGKLFGRDINRKDVLPFKTDNELQFLKSNKEKLA